ncbi:hypothetical protein [Glycocaulis sp.]|uniref:hypothetical protein n=1 Tax=Glycocaulis sp. TaxID=1969725 RepID=UPI003D2111DB
MKHPITVVLLFIFLAGLLFAGSASQGQEETAAEHRLRIIDLTPRFVAFYDAAEGLDPDERWALWEEMYRFAAVPPTPEGQTMARSLLDQAWPHYEGVIDALRLGAEELGYDAEESFLRVAELFDAADTPLEVQVLYFVGGFERNAFMAGNAPPMVALPVENGVEYLEITGPHELIHAVHVQLSGSSGGWERSVANAILSEGLAMRGTQALYPDLPATRHLAASEEWIAEMAANETGILEGLRPLLTQSDSQTIGAVLMGPGPSGQHREAYYAGWVLTAQLLDEGWTFSRLARIPDEDMPDLLDGAIARRLDQDR